MTNEEVERAIQFILQQQAQFWTSVQSLEGAVRSLEGIARDHTVQIGQLTDLVLRLGRIVEEQGLRFEKRMDRTDQRLDTLIATVDRYISRHNGNH